MALRQGVCIRFMFQPYDRTRRLWVKMAVGTQDPRDRNVGVGGDKMRLRELRVELLKARCDAAGSADEFQSILFVGFV